MKDSLSFKNIFKRETKLATYIIICLTIVVLSLSYAMFFKVDGNSKNQVVKAGDLEFTYENSAKEITNTTSGKCFTPMTNEETSLFLGTCDYKLSVYNSGSLKGAYTIKLKANEGNTIDDKYLKVVLRKQEGDTLQVVSGFESGKKISELSDGILIEDEEMASGSTIVYSIFLYVDEDSLSGLESSVIDEIIAQKLSYSIEGTGLVHETEKIDSPTFAEKMISCFNENKNGATCLIENASSNARELAYDNTTDNNLRYIGANPNNHVSFNNELWRIIGVFNNIDDGAGNRETRIKIIRNETYSENIAWDTANKSNWVSSSLKEELNTTFLNNIASPYKEMFKIAKWHLGKSDHMRLSSESYTFERGTDTFEGYESEWIGSIGLMYPSDYGYATGDESRENCLNNIVYDWGAGELAICNANNWINNKGLFEWTITPYSTEEVLRIGSGGGIYPNTANITGRAATPVIYLNANVKISGGEGTESSPYTLTME